MRKFFLYSVVSLIALAFLFGLLFLRGLLDFDLSAYSQTEVQFSTDQGLMAGTLILPASAGDVPVAIFVHGDGPQDRFAGDGYLIPMKLLLDAGIGVFSWDKPGIGASEGNWLHQSMSDRAQGVTVALDVVRNLEGVDPQGVGFLGFSQAGWVVPGALGPGTEAAFGILVGGAVNWEDQGAYYKRQRLARGGEGGGSLSSMSDDRREFVLRNQSSDATTELGQISVPFLALFGAKDLNVDPVGDAATYRETAEPLRPENKVIVVGGATHGLLRAGLFNYQLISEWPDWTVLAYVIAGRYAYSPGVWEQMSDWIGGVVPHE